ncbi:MAG: hypothetical protein N2D54_10095 [Chloroflexota bacterium]
MKMSKRALIISLLLVAAVLLSACGSGDNSSNSSNSADSDNVPAQGKFVEQGTATPAPDLDCQAIETNPTGDFNACVTSHCSQLFEDYSIHYSEETDVDQCSTDNLVGICSRADFDVYYYDGDATDLQNHCALYVGTWANP